jgi:hypothetical protein
VSNRLLLVALIIGIQVIIAASATAADALTVKVFPFTGEVQFLNEFGTPAEFVFYSITSASGSLHADDGVWLSVADTYDAPAGMTPGNGFIDPDNEWVELSPTPMNLGEEVAEGAPLGSGGMLPPVRGISLGRILDPGISSTDLTVVVKKADETPLTIDLEDAIAGDYNENRKVDMPDYTFWRNLFGSKFALFADGNLNGIVDAADFTIWRDNLGKELPGAAGGEAAGLGVGLATAAVPEPATLLLAIGVGSGLFLLRRHRPQR